MNVLNKHYYLKLTNGLYNITLYNNINKAK